MIIAVLLTDLYLPRLPWALIQGMFKGFLLYQIGEETLRNCSIVLALMPRTYFVDPSIISNKVKLVLFVFDK